MVIQAGVLNWRGWEDNCNIKSSFFGCPEGNALAVDIYFGAEQFGTVLDILQLDEAELVLSLLAHLSHYLQSEVLNPALAPYFLFQLFLADFVADPADKDIFGFDLLKAALAALVPLPRFVPVLPSLPILPSISAVTFFVSVVSALVKFLAELLQAVRSIFVDDLQIVGLLVLDHLFEFIEIVPEHIELDFFLLLGEVGNLDALEQFLEGGHVGLPLVC